MGKNLIKISLILFFLIVSCNVQKKSTDLKYFPVDDLNGIITQSGIQLDKSVSSDSNGSIKIEASNPATITLYDILDIRIDDAQLIYEAKLKSEGLSGQAYLEMWCMFKDKGEFFSRGFDTAIAGTTDWTTVNTFFFLKKNEMPDQIRLNLVVNGVGTVWIDDVHLSKLKLSM
ncbi:MAG: hypothetical protein WBQ32_09330 [Ignavibacteriaceae bacterium]